MTKKRRRLGRLGDVNIDEPDNDDPPVVPVAHHAPLAIEPDVGLLRSTGRVSASSESAEENLA